jgi:diguanylate cyclase (GGDEF)-like protein
LLGEINTWLTPGAGPAFSAETAALYEQRLGTTRRQHLALALLLTAVAVLTVAALDHANAPAQFAHALNLRIVSFTFCLGGAVAMLRARPGFQEAAIYCVPLMAQMVLAVWVGTHGSQVMIDRNILGSLMLFGVLVSVPPVPGDVARVLASVLFGVFVLTFIATAGLPEFWQHRIAALAGAVSLSVGALLSHWRDIARRREFLQTLGSETTARELGRVNAEMERLMNIDVLTGVANRRRFETDMQAAWPSRHTKAGLGLLLVDVDHFKSFNDCAGHAEGDTCLREIASAISGVVRGGSFSMARWGGEEFVVLAPGIARSDMPGLGERVRRAVENLAIPHPAWNGRRVTVSIGAAWCGNDAPCSTPDDLLRSADEALYEAKSRGRNRVIGPVRESALQAVAH